MTQVTIKLPITADLQTKDNLFDTLLEYTGSYNRICKIGWILKRINGVELHKQTYQIERTNTILPSQLVCSARMKAVESLKSAKTWQKKRDAYNKRAKEQNKKLKKTILCPYSELIAIRYDARSARIRLKEDFATLASVSGRQRVAFTIPEYYKNRIDWKVCSSDLLLDKQGKFWLHVVVENPNKQEFKWNNEVVGIDVGETHPAVSSLNKFLGKKRWKEVDDRYFRLSRDLQAKGTKSAKRHLKKISKRRTRFRKDCDHVMSKQIVQSCSKGSLIAVEDIKHIRNQVKKRGTKARRRFNAWSFNRLQTYIEYKAKLQGCKVEKVDPRNTSKGCSVCGNIDKKNRKSQANFKCTECGYTVNADINASRNIRNRLLASKGISLTSGRIVNPPIVTPSGSYKPTASAVGG